VQCRTARAVSLRQTECVEYGTVSPAPFSAAEESEIVLQEGLRNGRPVMIPGEFEVRAGRSTASSTEVVPRVTFPMPRVPMPHRSVFERVWRYVMRPTDTPTT
jgi:hypothetical protein